MQTLESYIQDRYSNDIFWFVTEVGQGNNSTRISKVINNQSYLLGNHKILLRKDSEFKGEVLTTKKLVLNQAKTILNFHSTYLLGKPLTITGSNAKVEAYQNIYRRGHYADIDFKVLDNAIRYADSYEYVYIDGKKNIVSKIISSDSSFPIYSEDDGSYIGFIESYTIRSNNVTYYNVYTMDTVVSYSNEGSEVHMLDTKANLSGLPIHYSNGESDWSNFGVSLLEDLMPIFDEFEDIMSKLSDSVYILSLSPIPVVTGQSVEGSIPSNACGYSVNLDNGDMKYVSANIDSATVKMYLDKLSQQLSIISSMPSVAMGNSNVANVSEVSLKLLYQLADVMAMMNERWIRRGLTQRFDMFDKLLDVLGKGVSDEEYADVEFNYSRPVNAKELLEQIKVQFDMGAISVKSIIEKSPITTDVMSELSRLEEEVEKVDVVDTEVDKVDDVVVE
jgi:SPP1 family phage portal protein